MSRGLATRKLTYVCVLALGIGALANGLVVGQQPPAFPPPPSAIPQSPPTAQPSPPPGPPTSPLPSPPPGSYQPHPPGPGAAPPALPPAPTPPAVKPAPAESPLDTPLKWLYEAQRNYTQVRDYTCTLRKQERVRGAPQEENIILFSYREKPQSIHMKWLAPAKVAYQEVIYVKGRNNDNMRVKPHGLVGAGLIPWNNVGVNDPRVLQNSRHNITEAGINHMMEKLITNLEIEKQLNKTMVRTADYQFDGRRCIRLETTRPQRQDAFYSFRTVVYLDEKSKFPIRMENYDWPTAGGSENGDLLEKFSYYDLHFNVGLREELFSK